MYTHRAKDVFGKAEEQFVVPTTRDHHQHLILVGKPAECQSNKVKNYLVPHADSTLQGKTEIGYPSL